MSSEDVNAGKQLVGVDRVAELAGISVRGVWRAVARQELPRPGKIGQRSLWLLSDVWAYIERVAHKAQVES